MTLKALPEKSTSEDNFSWSFGSVYKLIPGLSIRANIAEAFCMPTADQLFSYLDYGSWGIYAGNEDLEPETSQTFEIGIDYTNKGLTTSLTYFYTEYDNYITTKEVSSGYNEYTNIEGATISGFEGSIKYNLGDTLDWNFTFEPYASFTVLTEYKNEETGEHMTQTPGLERGIWNQRRQ